MIERKRHGRKLLVASIGVAAVSYVACGGSTTDTSTSGPVSGSGGSTATAGAGGNGNTAGTFVGNTGGSVFTDGSVNTGGSPVTDGQIAVGNLMVIPFDSGSAGSNIKDASPAFDNIIIANLIAPPPSDAKADTK